MMHLHTLHAWSLVLLIVLQSINWSFQTPQEYWFPEGHMDSALNQALDLTFLLDPQLENPDLAKHYEDTGQALHETIQPHLRFGPLGTYPQYARYRSQIHEENHTQFATIQQGFKSLWENVDSLNNVGQIQAWFEFLSYVMFEPKKEMPHARSAIYFGIYSLQTKYRDNDDITLHIAAMKKAMKKIAPGDYHGWNEDWGRVFTGEFSDYLLDMRNLKILAPEIGTFGKALMKWSKHSVEEMVTEFSQYDSYKRVLALAIFNRFSDLQMITHRESMELFYKNLNEKTFFLSYELPLVEKLSKTHERRMSELDKAEERMRERNINVKNNHAFCYRKSSRGDSAGQN